MAYHDKVTNKWFWIAVRALFYWHRDSTWWKMMTKTNAFTPKKLKKVLSRCVTAHSTVTFHFLHSGLAFPTLVSTKSMSGYVPEVFAWQIFSLLLQVKEETPAWLFVYHQDGENQDTVSTFNYNSSWLKPSAFHCKTLSDSTFAMVLSTLFPSLVALFVMNLHSTFIQLCKSPLPVISSFMNLQWGIMLLSIIAATSCSKIIPSVAFYILSKQFYCQHLPRFVGLHCHLRKKKKPTTLKWF